MHDGRTALEKEALDAIQRRGIKVLKKAKPESLGDRRLDAIKDGISSGALDPRGATLGIQPAACFRKFPARLAFCALQTSR
jgi:hypothetical protein